MEGNAGKIKGAGQYRSYFTHEFYNYILPDGYFRVLFFTQQLLFHQMSNKFK